MSGISMNTEDYLDNGMYVGGVTSILRSISKLKYRLEPDYIYIVFDRDKSDYRLSLLPTYKGKRKLAPEVEYRSGFNSIAREILEDILPNMGVYFIEYCDGIEADDVIANIARQILGEDEECIIVSTDKDFLQLVDDKTKVYSPTKKKLYDREMVKAEWGMYPQNLLLFRTLDGDNSDNIPGVKGCGLKTVLKRFPELEEDRLITFDEFFDICEAKKDDAKIYADILSQKNEVLRNRQIMQLEEAQINTNQTLKILDRFNEPNKKFDKMDFIKAAMKYKILQNWKDINDWLKSTYTNIIVK
jgi:5'-3' exonuclease